MEKQILISTSTTGRIQLGGRLIGIQFPAAMTATFIAIKPVYGNASTGQLVYDTSGNLDTNFLIQVVLSGYVCVPLDKTRDMQYIEIISCDINGTAVVEAATITLKLHLTSK